MKPSCENQITSAEKPFVTVELAKNLAFKYFGIKTVFIKELESYGDRNFYIESSNDVNKDSGNTSTDHQFVFKILNSEDSVHFDIVDSQNLCMFFLKERQISTSCPLTSIGGKHTVLVQVDSNLYATRLMNFLPGKMLKDVIKVEPSMSPTLLYKTGKFLARLDKELKDFQNQHLASFKSSCDLQNIGDLEEFINPEYIYSDENRDLVSQVLKNYMKNVPPVLEHLPKQFIHSDATDKNIILNDNEISIIDFGDLCYSYRVFEVAIAIADIIWSSCDGPNISNAGCLLRGYQSVFPLDKAELSILSWCIAGRFVQALIFGSLKLSTQPDNDYVKRIVCPVWGTLRNFVAMDHSSLLNQWVDK